MLTQKVPVARIRRQVAEPFCGQKSTSGGSRESGAKAWQANPAGPSASAVVMTVTPVPK
ncbi:hypothetical protein Aph02nite_10890 [Actinoplanes philippinensis]|nr:hypothetical protein Aph02nite_10890 [Actinoplanes philippinensis]